MPRPILLAPNLVYPLDDILTLVDTTSTEHITEILMKGMAAVERILGALFMRLSSNQRHAKPRAFWRTELGWAVAMAQLYARQDELMTIAEAAVLLHGVSNSTTVNYGILTEYIDFKKNNFRRQSRVSLFEVAHLKAQNSCRKKSILK